MTRLSTPNQQSQVGWKAAMMMLTSVDRPDSRAPIRGLHRGRLRFSLSMNMCSAISRGKFCSKREKRLATGRLERRDARFCASDDDDEFLVCGLEEAALPRLPRTLIGVNCMICPLTDSHLSPRLRSLSLSFVSPAGFYVCRLISEMRVEMIAELVRPFYERGINEDGSREKLELR